MSIHAPIRHVCRVIRDVKARLRPVINPAPNFEKLQKALDTIAALSEVVRLVGRGNFSPPLIDQLRT